jgi:hypothetical protein
MREWTPAQALAIAAAATILLVGALGFVPGITTHYGDLGFAGQGSGAKLLGVFRVSIVLNLVHLLVGAAGLTLARSAETARAFLSGGGVFLLGLWLLGVAGAGAWIPLDTADNWLHFVLGLALIALARTALPTPRLAAPA